MLEATQTETGFGRRAFLRIGAAAAGALLIGFPLRPAKAEAGIFAPDAFIRIAASGDITLIMPQVEMGQGIYTAISMILAEELDAAFDRITLEAAPPNTKLYANPLFGIQATGWFHIGPRVVDVAAQGRRRGAGSADRGCGGNLGGRTNDLPHR